MRRAEPERDETEEHLCENRKHRTASGRCRGTSLEPVLAAVCLAQYPHIRPDAWAPAADRKPLHPSRHPAPRALKL
ncbi:hypothetical protein NDU88_008080 [Pleurodeles waltl]|uniref:Uncharacterized protein n=1 Tax=Pleurodeles waltl TaxID=8319 RepID=A0AAV7QQS4_PLEWA|nr:hypothetical protein NDU88_008080 [Pleurodeles waltl]